MEAVEVAVRVIVAVGGRCVNKRENRRRYASQKEYQSERVPVRKIPEEKINSGIGSRRQMDGHKYNYTHTIMESAQFHIIVRGWKKGGSL